MAPFKDLPLSHDTLKGLRDSGYIDPTDIQEQTIGYALDGKDVLGAAKTGSGKTLAFIIPVLETLCKERWCATFGVGAMIITPTRELAYQIFEVLNRVGKYHDFSAGLMIGGKDLKFEWKRVDRCNIIVCTPGRLLQHMDQNSLFNCDQMKIVVLDEADRILDLGFAKTMNAIIGNLPQERQTLLFSATQTRSVKDLARLSLKDPVFVSVHEKSEHTTPDGLRQSYVVCELHEKLDLLWSFLKSHPHQKILVFMSSCKQVKFSYELFKKLKPGSSLLSLYGTLHQMRRMAVYDEFCRKQSVILFATDIASRGLDFPEVDWVLQLDCPEDVNTYIHRAGRTARYNKNGQSLLVLLPSEKESMLKQLKGRKIPIEDLMINPQKLQSIQRRAEAFCACHLDLKESAQRAFKSYFKNVYLMKDKSIFDVRQLNKELFARSLGLEVTPRIRFLEKSKNSGQKPNEEVKKSVQLLSDSESEKDEADHDLFTVKSTWRYEGPLNSSSTDPALPEPQSRQKSSKAVTKANVAKKLMKKRIKPNTKLVFNDEGTVIEDFPKHQTSEKIKELDERNVSGIDIPLAQEIMKDEDVVDKKVYKKLISDKHKEKKRKEKEKRMRDKFKDKRTALLGPDEDNQEEDDEDNHLNQLIDGLPDPDKYYGRNDGDDRQDYDGYNSEDYDDDDHSSDKGNKSKRRKLASSSSSEEGDDDHNVEIEGQESLALHLLKGNV